MTLKEVGLVLLVIAVIVAAYAFYVNRKRIRDKAAYDAYSVKRDLQAAESKVRTEVLGGYNAAKREYQEVKDYAQSEVKKKL